MLNDPLNALDPAGEDILYLSAPSAFYGKGHSAALIGNDKTGWQYFSYAAGPSWFNDDDNLTRKKWRTLKIAVKSLAKGKYKFTQYLRWETVPKEDKKAIQKVLKIFPGKTYWIIGRNCDDVIVHAVLATNRDIDDRLIPNKTFKNSTLLADDFGKFTINDLYKTTLHSRWRKQGYKIINGVPVKRGVGGIHPEWVKRSIARGKARAKFRNVQYGGSK